MAICWVSPPCTALVRVLMLITQVKVCKLAQCTEPGTPGSIPGKDDKLSLEVKNIGGTDSQP